MPITASKALYSHSIQILVLETRGITGLTISMLRLFVVPFMMKWFLGAMLSPQRILALSKTSAEGKEEELVVPMPSKLINEENEMDEIEKRVQQMEVIFLDVESYSLLI